MTFASAEGRGQLSALNTKVARRWASQGDANEAKQAPFVVLLSRCCLCLCLWPRSSARPPGLLFLRPAPEPKGEPRFLTCARFFNFLGPFWKLVRFGVFAASWREGKGGRDEEKEMEGARRQKKSLQVWCGRPAGQSDIVAVAATCAQHNNGTTFQRARARGPDQKDAAARSHCLPATGAAR